MLKEFRLTRHNEYKRASKYFFVFTCSFTIVNILMGSSNYYFVLGLALIAILLWFGSLDKKPIITIDSKGILIEDKYIYILWTDIYSFKTMYENGIDGGLGDCIMEFTLKKEKIEIRYQLADKSIEEVRNALILFSSEYNVKDGGHYNNPDNEFKY